MGPFAPSGHWDQTSVSFVVAEKSSPGSEGEVWDWQSCASRCLQSPSPLFSLEKGSQGRRWLLGAVSLPPGCCF